MILWLVLNHVSLEMNELSQPQEGIDRERVSPVFNENLTKNPILFYSAMDIILNKAEEISFLDR